MTIKANIAAARLTIDGRDLSGTINPRLVSLNLTESREEGADRLDITLTNHDGQLAPIKKGVEIELALGWKQGANVTPGMVDKGRFKVDEVERGGPPDTVTIRARSADLTGGYRKRKDKAHKDKTLGEIVREVAKANGLTAKVHASIEGKTIPLAEQAGKSDMQFIRDLGRRFDATATVKNKTLIFAPIGKGETASGKTLPTLSLEKVDGWSWRFTTADRADHDGAEAGWHDQDEGKRKTVKTGGGKNPKRLKRTYASEADAKAATEAEHKRNARAVNTFDYELAWGDAAIIPERPVALTGWDSEIDGLKWVVKEATHSFDASGLKTRITLETKT